LDTNENDDRRCRAIEDLDQRSVTLDNHLINELLSDENITVARYALGLVATSPARDRLILEADHLPHNSDTSFKEELNLLKKMVDDEK
jgi:hypothetical protein